MAKRYDSNGNVVEDIPQPKRYDASGGLIDRLLNPPNSGVQNVPEDQQIHDLSGVGRHIIDVAKPFVTGLGTAAGLGAAALNPEISIPASIALGATGGFGANWSMQKLKEGLGGPPQSVWDTLQDTGEQGVFNEGGAIIGSKIGQLFKGLIAPTKLGQKFGMNSNELKDNFIQNSPVAQRLQGIYDSMIEKGGGPSYAQQNPGPIITHVEDILGGKNKQTQLKNAAKAGTSEGVDLANKLGGTAISEFEDPFKVAQRFGGDLEKTKQAYQFASNNAAARAKNIAALNPVRVLTGYKEVKSGVLDAQGNAVVTKVPQYADINGPVTIPNAYDIADKFLRKQDENYGKKSTVDLMGIVEDSKKPLVRAALDIVKAGRNVPIPFDVAWELKQAAAEHGGFGEISQSFKQGQFSSLTGAIDHDIETSMEKWNGGKSAIQSYSTAKALVSNRHDLYQSKDDLSNILKATPGDSAKPEFDRILTDPLMTGKAMTAAGPDGRKNLGSYQVQKIMQDSLDRETGVYDRKKLLDAWRDPNKQGVYDKLYNSAQRSDINNFFEALSNVSTKQSGMGQIAAAFRVGSAGFHIAGSILTGAAAMHDAYSGTIVGATIATSEIVKRVLLDPKKARTLTILMNQGPTSGESKFLARQVFGALNGVRIALETKDGKKIGGTIEDGKVTPDQ